MNVVQGFGKGVKDAALRLTLCDTNRGNDGCVAGSVFRRGRG